MSCEKKTNGPQYCPIFSRATDLLLTVIMNCFYNEKSQQFLDAFVCKQLPHQLTTTAMIKILKTFLFSSNFSSVRQTTSNHHYHKQVPFAISWTVLLLLVPFQAISEAMIIPISSPTNSISNQKLERETNDVPVIRRSLNSNNNKTNPKFETLRITEHQCFSLKNDNSCNDHDDCRWCKPWCIADGVNMKMTCEEISSYLPHVTSVLPPVLLTGMPTLIMIVGTHLTSPNNSLLAVEFELPEGENRSCEILEPKSEQEIRCILEGVDQKKGTLLHPKLRYMVNLRGTSVPGDIDANNETVRVVTEDERPLTPDIDVEEGDDDDDAWWKSLHTLHYMAVMLALFGGVGVIGSFLIFKRKQAQALVGLLKRRLLMGQMKRTLVKSGLYAEYSSVTLKTKLGDGNFGEVYRAEVVEIVNGSEEKMEVAIKRLRKGSSLTQVREFLTEGVRMSAFEHERILRPMAITVDSTSPWMPAIILPIMANGDLCRYLRKSKVFPIVKLLTFAVQIAEGMEYLASANFVHGDLAARNCLLDEKYQLKIGDFGLCRQLAYRSDYVTINDIYRPVRWMAVECLTAAGSGKNKNKSADRQPKFSLASDVWSFGVLLWEIFTLGSYPYEEFDNWSLVKAIEGGYRLHRPLNCPTAVYALMSSCWEEVPAKRPTMTQIRTNLGGLLTQVMAEMNGGHSELAHSSVREHNFSYTSLAERYVQNRRISGLSTASGRSESSMASASTITSHLA